MTTDVARDIWIACFDSEADYSTAEAREKLDDCLRARIDQLDSMQEHVRDILKDRRREAFGRPSMLERIERLERTVFADNSDGKGN